MTPERKWRDFAATRGLEWTPTRAIGRAGSRRHGLMLVSGPTLRGDIEDVVVSVGWVPRDGKTHTRATGRAVERLAVRASLSIALGARGLEVPKSAAALFDDRLRAALSTFTVSRASTFEYDRGVAALWWAGQEQEEGVVDAALDVVVSACRWRPAHGAYR